MDNDNLKYILTKRFQTTMIGALFEFEKNFGHLWGQFKNENENLTEAEEKYLDLWEYTRNLILNNGNNQLRKCLSDIAPVKYKYTFYNRRKED